MTTPATDHIKERKSEISKQMPYRRVLRRPDVSERTGLGRSTLYAYIEEGRFPRPIRLGPRAVGWIEEEVDEWISDRISERGGGDS